MYTAKLLQNQHNQKPVHQSSSLVTSVFRQPSRLPVCFNNCPKHVNAWAVCVCITALTRACILPHSRLRSCHAKHQLYTPSRPSVTAAVAYALRLWQGPERGAPKLLLLLWFGL